MNVVLTGATGFIGSAVRAKLVGAGHRVEAWSIDGAQDSLAVDLSNSNAMTSRLMTAEAEAVIHVAGTTPHNRANADLAWYLSHDAVWTATLLAAAAEARLGRVIALGSADEYGTSPSPQRPGGEKAATSAYGCAKKCSTDILAFGASTMSIETVVLRPFAVYGPGQPGTMLIPSLIGSARLGTPCSIGPLGRIRDFVHVDDVAEAVLSTLVAPTPLPVMNVGTGIGTTVAAVVKLIEDALEMTLVVEPGKARPSDPEELVADIKGTVSAIDWHPTIDLQDGIVDLVAGGAR